MDFRILGLFTGIYSHHLRKSADDLQVVLNCLLRHLTHRSFKDFQDDLLKMWL